MTKIQVTIPYDVDKKQLSWEEVLHYAGLYMAQTYQNTASVSLDADIRVSLQKAKKEYAEGKCKTVFTSAA